MKKEKQCLKWFTGIAVNRKRPSSLYCRQKNPLSQFYGKIINFLHTNTNGLIAK